jgi:hypothetical protein
MTGSPPWPFREAMSGSLARWTGILCLMTISDFNNVISIVVIFSCLACFLTYFPGCRSEVRRVATTSLFPRGESCRGSTFRLLSCPLEFLGKSTQHADCYSFFVILLYFWCVVTCFRKSASGSTQGVLYLWACITEINKIGSMYRLQKRIKLR